MYLHALTLKGFRQFVDTTVYLSDATFIIGQNNTGKSSILKAIDCLLRGGDKLHPDDCLQMQGSDFKNQIIAEEVEIIGEFRNLPKDATLWRGFKGRLLPYDASSDGNESGLRIFYRKTFPIDGSKGSVWMRQNPRSRKADFNSCTKPKDFIAAGLSKEIFNGIRDAAQYEKKLTDDELQLLDDIWDIDYSQEEWFQNPGGIPGNVLSRLPHFLFIPAQDRMDEIANKTGTLVAVLKELFEAVRENSTHYQEARRHLDLLEKEFDPANTEGELGKMMSDLNGVLSDVFPKSKINANASLSDPNKVLSPEFNVSMESNIKTPITHQGTGLIRSAVFALLRYKARRDSEQAAREKGFSRPLIIGFEEPEIYLHPQAAYQMREVIYELAKTENNQIVCTTHSPYMIDLSKKPRQILNYCDRIVHTKAIEIETIDVRAFNVSEAFRQIEADEKQHVKMMLKIDDSIAKVFFCKKILIVEGDTEEVVIKRTLDLLNAELRKKILTEWQIVRAHGKATIISLVKYLQAMDLKPVVMHDHDTEAGATKYNQPIANSVGDSNRIFVLQNCVEDVLGYAAPSSEKPYTAFRHISAWQSKEDISADWWRIFSKIFDIQEVVVKEVAA